MINGVKVSDSGVELSPPGTDRRGRPENRHPTARFELLRPDRRGGSCGGATHGQFLLLQLAHCYALVVKTSTRGPPKACQRPSLAVIAFRKEFFPKPIPPPCLRQFSFSTLIWKQPGHPG